MVQKILGTSFSIPWPFRQATPEEQVQKLIKRVESIFEKNPARALKDCNSVLVLDPKNAQALYLRARCEDRQNHPEKAIKDFTAALALKPQDADILSKRAESYFKHKKYAEAIRDCTQVLEQKPDDAEMLKLRARSYKENKDFARAITDYTALLKVKNVKAFFMERAGCYLADKQYDLAIRDLTDFLLIDNPRGETLYQSAEDDKVFLMRAEAYFEKGEYQLSIENAKNAFAKQVEYDPAMDILIAKAYMKLGKFEKVIEEISSFTPKEGRFFEPYHLDLICLKGQCFRALGKEQEAILEFSKVLEHYPDHVEAKKGIGVSGSSR